MTTFGKYYSKYYNLLYKDKNYEEEVNYINEIIKNYSKRDCKTILDIGCGTGKHLKIFKDAGFDVSGIDISENMIAEARYSLGQNETLYCCKASDFCLNKKFDVIISLFHVVSYQTQNQELEALFNNVYKHLEEGGIFIFDFWYGPAVLTNPPVVRIKRLQDEEIGVIRIAEPVMFANENIIDVNYEVLIEDKKTCRIEKINEVHKMRYFFLPEIEHFLTGSKLEMNVSYEWMKSSDISANSWYGLVVAER